MILRILRAEVTGPAQLELAFNDGSEVTVDVTSLLQGPIFEPLHDPQKFAEMTLDPVCGTVTWPNGADLAPEALHALSPIAQTASTN